MRPHQYVFWAITALSLALCGCGGADAGAAPSFSASPQDLTVAEGESFAFMAKTEPESASLQWRRDGTPIAGATGARVSGIATAADDGARFDVTATAEGQSSSSAPATLRVNRWHLAEWWPTGSLYTTVKAALADNGDAVVLWCEQRDASIRTLNARHYVATTDRWSAPMAIGVNCTGTLDVAMDASGNAYAAWTDWDGLPGSVAGVSMKRFDADRGTWEAGNLVAPVAGRGVSTVMVRTGPAGHAAVLFGRIGTGVTELCFARHVAGAWQRDERLSSMPVSVGSPDFFDAAIGAEGDLQVATTQDTLGLRSVFAQSHRLSDNTVTAPAPLASGSLLLTTPRFAQRGRQLMLGWASAAADAVGWHSASWSGGRWSAVTNVRLTGGAALSLDTSGNRVLGFAVTPSGEASAALEARQLDGRYRRLVATRDGGGRWIDGPASPFDALAGTVSGDRVLFASETADAQAVVSRVLALAVAGPRPLRSDLRIERLRVNDGWHGGASNFAATGNEVVGLDHDGNAQGRLLIAWIEFPSRGAPKLRTSLLLPVRR
ncbi:hypothetical protein [Methylibium rhizosphaerae]|uniref:hypothetical protein n=1 Tax=Methylibium rhizosphaerae TaxID=2570323 RepID=UPI00112E8CBF|nr:hypothetical protein [Methylibium rhizosphaerae]